MKPLYTAKASVTGGRNGHVTSSDGILNLDVRIPKEMGGTGGATNPEQLFAAGYSACFDSALQHVARLKKVPLEKSEVTAEVTIGSNDTGGFSLAVKMNVKLKVSDEATAKDLINTAHQVCPYSNATRGNIPVDLSWQLL
jgi:Ohr subfamily peroxiredoxin